MSAPPEATDAARMPGAVWVYLAWGLFMGAPLWVLVTVLTAMTHQEIGALASLPSYAARGPQVLEGSLVASGERLQTPAGATAVGWAGEVRSTTRSGKSTTGSTLCTAARLDGLSLALADGRTLALRDGPFHVSEDHSDLVASLTSRGRAARLVRGDVSVRSAVPTAMAARCALEPLHERETRSYVEHRLARGALYTFVGCREGDALGPCPGDHALGGHLVRGTRTALFGEVLATYVVTYGAACLLMLFFSVVAAGAVWSSLRRYRGLGRAPW